MHEISRDWHTDVAQFALTRGADVNKSDNYGRTPLHLAAAVNYAEMVFWLITNGGIDILIHLIKNKNSFLKPLSADLEFTFKMEICVFYLSWISTMGP